MGKSIHTPLCRYTPCCEDTSKTDDCRSLRQDLRSAHDNNTKLLLELRDQQREQGTLQRDVTNMQREMDDVREKNFVITEDVATLKAEMGIYTVWPSLYFVLKLTICTSWCDKSPHRSYVKTKFPCGAVVERPLTMPDTHSCTSRFCMH